MTQLPHTEDTAGAPEGVPIAEGLFTWPAPRPHLLGSRCSDCGTHAFPAQASCPRCCSEDVERIELASRGTLWSFTIQGFPPKSPPYLGPDADPAVFRPYGVGYVELPGQVRVEARLHAERPEDLRIGMPMELVIEPFRRDDQGRDVMIYAFRPVAEA